MILVASGSNASRWKAIQIKGYHEAEDYQLDIFTGLPPNIRAIGVRGGRYTTVLDEIAAGNFPSGWARSA